MSTLEQIEGLKDARQKKKLTQDALAVKVGLDQPTISNLEAGRLSMGRGVAEKLAPAVGSNPLTLLFENCVRCLETSKKRGDARGVFAAAKKGVKLLEDLELSAEDEAEAEAAMNELVQAAISFAETISGAAREAASTAEATANKRQGDPYMAGLAGEGRDITGRKVAKSANRDAENYFDDYLHPSHRGSAFISEKAEEDDDEAYDDEEGRDPITGIRL